MREILVNIPEHDVEKLDDLVRRKLYPNRNEAIRFAIKDLIRQEWTP